MKRINDLQSVGMMNISFKGIDGFPQRTSSYLPLPHLISDKKKRKTDAKGSFLIKGNLKEEKKGD